MYVLDTCALIWGSIEPGLLSSKAQEAFRKIEQHGAFISSISIWEIGIKIKRNKLNIGTSIEDFTLRIKRRTNIEIVPVDETIWLENLSLDWKHKDPADRTIVATARLKNLPIITNDENITRFYKKIVW